MQETKEVHTNTLLVNVKKLFPAIFTILRGSNGEREERNRRAQGVGIRHQALESRARK